MKERQSEQGPYSVRSLAPLAPTPQAVAIGCSAVLDRTLIFHCDDEFSLGASFSKIPERVRDLTQRIPPVNGRDDGARFTELRYGDQILETRLNRQEADVPA